MKTGRFRWAVLVRLTRRLALTAIFGLVALHMAEARGSDSAGSALSTSDVDAIVERALELWGAPGATVSIVHDGRVILSRGYGVRDLDSGAAMTSSTLFPMQSEAKAFTALTLAILDAEGKLDLDAPAARYLPGLRMADAAASLDVTLRDFLVHRSGLGSYGWFWLTNTKLDRAGAVERVQHLPPAAPFRSAFVYSNVGYVLAARAVETATGTSWEQFLRNRVLTPIGMNRTTTSLEQALADPDHSAGSMQLWGRVRRTPMQGTTPLTNSTGGIYSTSDDMARWMLFQLGDGSVAGTRIISTAGLAETHQGHVVTGRPVPPPEFTSSEYGLGWYVDSYRGERLINHQGNHWGVGSVVGLLPARKLGVSVFVNQDGDLSSYILLTVLDRVIAGGGRDWIGDLAPRPDERSSEPPRPTKSSNPGRPLAEYVGDYDDPGVGRISISLHRGALVAQSNDDRTVLAPVGADLFVPATREFGNIWSMQDGQRVRFVAGFQGQVTALVISSAEDGVVFEKADPNDGDKPP